jgi:hypothetical protein
MLKRLWKRLKRFFSRIKDAVVELFTGELPEETANKEETIKAEIVGEKKSEFGAWVRKIGGNMANFWKKQIEDFAENPITGTAKLTALTAALAIPLSFLEKIKRLFVNPLAKSLERREKMYDLYDHRWGMHWKLNKPLSPEEKNRIMLICRGNKWDVGTYLAKMGLLAI